jgi:hypothetical protein
LRAIAEVCEQPCPRVEPRVTLGWAAPDGGASPTGYRIVRDGAPLEVDVGTRRSFVDLDVVIGQGYAYQVVALSTEGDSPATEVVEALVPTPPDDAAHLAGVYRVRMTVRSARSIGAAFGIEDPIPGTRASDRWSFESTCGPDEGICSSAWSGLQGEIEPDGRRWIGTVQGLPARCGREGRAPAPIDVDLRAVDVGVREEAWVVTGFRGRASVSFRCPGFPAASATVEVTGTL